MPVEREQVVTGLISNISGMNTKQSLTLLSSQPAEDGWKFSDVTEQVAQQSGELPADSGFSGQARDQGLYCCLSKRAASSRYCCV